MRWSSYKLTQRISVTLAEGQGSKALESFVEAEVGLTQTMWVVTQVSGKVDHCVVAM